MQQSSDISREARADIGLSRPESLGPLEAARWHQPLRDSERPCGCKSGAALTLTALVGWPVWVLASGPPGTPVTVALGLVTYGSVVLGAGIAGKVIGIVVGSMRHRRLRRQLSQRLLEVGPGSGT